MCICMRICVCLRFKYHGMRDSQASLRAKRAHTQQITRTLQHVKHRNVRRNATDDHSSEAITLQSEKHIAALVTGEIAKLGSC